ncbi:MAG: nickel pincer cofactor biosynthesis protein LarB [Planctomycetaceae bacterium]
MIDWTQLQTLMEAASRGEVDRVGLYAALSQSLAASTVANTAPDPNDACLDLSRQQRCGHPEVIYGPGKPPESLVALIQRLQQSQQDVLVTRVSEEQAAFATHEIPTLHWNGIAKTLRLMAGGEQRRSTRRVPVITAGTSDFPIAEEVAETLRWMRIDCDVIPDVGVAGPERLLRVLPKLHEAPVIVVVAGMEGALPSVIGGWVRCPVIAVPTSVGYGAALGGLAALLGMLNSCAANVTVVNIDAGFKAGYLAGLIAEQTTAADDSRPCP